MTKALMVIGLCLSMLGFSGYASAGTGCCGKRQVNCACGCVKGGPCTCDTGCACPKDGTCACRK